MKQNQSTFNANTVYSDERELEEYMESVGRFSADELHSRLMRNAIVGGRNKNASATLADAVYRAIKIVAKEEMRNNRNEG